MDRRSLRSRKVSERVAGFDEADQRQVERGLSCLGTLGPGRCACELPACWDRLSEPTPCHSHCRPCELGWTLSRMTTSRRTPWPLAPMTRNLCWRSTRMPVSLACTDCRHDPGHGASCFAWGVEGEAGEWEGPRPLHTQACTPPLTCLAPKLASQARRKRSRAPRRSVGASLAACARRAAWSPKGSGAPGPFATGCRRHVCSLFGGEGRMGGRGEGHLGVRWGRRAVERRGLGM